MAGRPVLTSDKKSGRPRKLMAEKLGDVAAGGKKEKERRARDVKKP